MKDITLTAQDKERYDIIRSCIDKDITNAEAAARLHVKKRQVQNLKRSVEKYGEAGIIHGNHGCTPWNVTQKKTERAIVAFLKKKNHRDFGPTFAMEQLAKQKGVIVSRETIRHIMAEEKLWKPKERKGTGIHRQWRERLPMKGELVQYDGSYHDWFEDGEECCLLTGIDDATSDVPHAVFADNEGVHATFRFWWDYFEHRGLPVAIYLDKFSTYKVNHKSAVDNAEMMTQFERAMKELGVKVINANSPEAKGRIERLFCTLQDRLVKEMRLANIKQHDDANQFLKDTYLPDHNKRFSVAARQEGDAHRKLTRHMKAKLPSILSVQSQRRVNNDYTIQFKNRWLQLAATQPTTVYKGDIVTIEERLDGTLHVRLKDAYLDYTELPQRPKPTRMRVTALTREQPRWKPSADHPWRKAAAVVAARKESHHKN